MHGHRRRLSVGDERDARRLPPGVHLPEPRRLADRERKDVIALRGDQHIVETQRAVVDHFHAVILAIEQRRAGQRVAGGSR